MEEEIFEKYFNYESFFPLVLFIFGVYSIYLISRENYGVAMFFFLMSFVIYMTNNILHNIKGSPNVFNSYLEDMASFTAFGLSTIIFGVIFFDGGLLILFVILFYSICVLLSLARNWILDAKNSNGWPLVLNGLFFPIIYYIYIFYLQSPGESLFLIFYLLIGFLTLSHKNFIGYEENTKKNKDEINFNFGKRRI